MFFDFILRDHEGPAKNRNDRLSPARGFPNSALLEWRTPTGRKDPLGLIPGRVFIWARSGQRNRPPRGAGGFCWGLVREGQMSIQTLTAMESNKINNLYALKQKIPRHRFVRVLAVARETEKRRPEIGRAGVSQAHRRSSRGLGVLTRSECNARTASPRRVRGHARPTHRVVDPDHTS